MSRIAASSAAILVCLASGCGLVLGLDNVPPIAKDGTFDASLADAGLGDASRDDAGADREACGSGAVEDPEFKMQTADAGGPLVPPWSGEGPAFVGLDVMDGPGGSYCGYIADTGTGQWSAILQVVEVTPNTKYVLSAYVQTAQGMAGSAGSFPGGFLGVRTTASSVLSEQSFGETKYYTEVTVTFDSGNNSSVVIFVGFTSVEGQGSWLHADDFSLCPVT